MIKKVLLVIVLVAWALSLVGCQTVAGLGGDIKWTAETTADMLQGN